MPSEYKDIARWLRRLLVEGVERRTWIRLTNRFRDPDDLGRAPIEDIQEIAKISPAAAAAYPMRRGRMKTLKPKWTPWRKGECA